MAEQEPSKLKTGVRFSSPAFRGLCLLSVLAAGCVSGNGASSSAPTATASRVITRHSLAGIQLGQTQKDVERLTGPGHGTTRQGVRSVHYSLPAGRLTVDYGSLFADDPRPTVLDAWTTSPGFRTSEGVGVGSTLHDVNTLGEINCAPVDNRHEQCQTLAHGPGLEFTLVDERVVRVALVRRVN